MRRVLLGKYILDKHGDPQPCPDTLKWAAWIEDSGLRVAETYLSEGTWISTVFLGMDRNFSDRGRPILFETMVFQSPDYLSDTLDQARYCTWDEAVTGHAALVKLWTDRLDATGARITEIANAPTLAVDSCAKQIVVKRPCKGEAPK